MASRRTRWHRAFRATADGFWSDPQQAVEGRRDLIAASARIMAMTVESLGVPVTPDDAMAFSRDYRALRDSGAALFPGAVDVLSRLRSEGARLALITNGAAAAQRRKIERFHLGRYFDAILIEGELGYGKPDERVFKHALGLLDCPAAEALMVGDDFAADIVGASALGIPTVWVNASGAPLPGGGYQPDRVIERVTDLS